MKLLALLSVLITTSACCTLKVTPPAVVLSGVPFSIGVELPQYYPIIAGGSNGHHHRLAAVGVYPATLPYMVSDHVTGYVLGNGTMRFNSVNGSATNARLLDSCCVWPNNSAFQLSVRVGSLCSDEQQFIKAIPGFLSILPPVFTIVIAIATKQVILALLFGVFVAKTCIDLNAGTALLSTFTEYWVNAISEPDHSAVILFTLLLAGFIGILQKGGGAQALARSLGKFITTTLRGELALFLLTLCVFFDDYSSILIVGSALRGIIGLVKRQRYAFILHVIGVAVPSFAPVSSWVGVEVGYIAAAWASIGQPDVSAFNVFLQSIPFRLLPLGTLLFVIASVLLQRDFGGFDDDQDESDAAEARRGGGANDAGRQTSAAGAGGGGGVDEELGQEMIQELVGEEPQAEQTSTDPLAPKPGKPQRTCNAIAPILLVIVLVVTGMIVTGISGLKEEISAANIFAHAQSVPSLIWATVGGTLLLFVLLMLQKILTMTELMDAWLLGMSEVLSPVLILTLAWALGTSMQDIATSHWLVHLLGDSLPYAWLPTITAVVCCVVSFATGSSFGTMGIIFPLIIPLASKLSDNDEQTLTLCAGAILGCSIWGNMCSPLADNTILASAACQTTIPKHVRATLPHMLWIAASAILFGYALIALGMPAYLGLLVPLGVSVLALLLFGSPRRRGGGGRSPARMLWDRCRGRSSARGGNSVASSESDALIINGNAKFD